jgi:hypothetical protein
MFTECIIDKNKHAISYRLKSYYQGFHCLSITLVVFLDLQEFPIENKHGKFNIFLSTFDNFVTSGYQYNKTPSIFQGLGKRTLIALITKLYRDGIINSSDIIGVEAQGSAGVDKDSWDYDLLPLAKYYQRNFGFTCDLDLHKISRIDLDEHDDGLPMFVTVETFLRTVQE